MSQVYCIFTDFSDNLLVIENEFSAIYALTGRWKEFLKKQAAIESDIKFFTWIDPYVWMGRYLEAQHNAEIVLRSAIDADDQNAVSGTYRSMGYALGMQLRFQESDNAFQQSLKSYEKCNREELNRWNGTLGFWWAVLLKQGKLGIAETQILYRLNVKKEIQDFIGIPELLDGLGQICEIRCAWEKAEEHYRNCLKLAWTGRHYFECSALAGLVRIKHAQGDHAAIPPLLAEAEQLAQQYEYNDHLASLRLTQGHLAWEGKAPTRENGFDSALHFYQHALIYALRYNRFLLDELLSGRPQGMPLRPIIPYCLERGEEGKKILTALRDWWKTGINVVRTPRPDTISPIPEGIPLLEAEKIAREREPGDGSMQRSVIEQIEAAIGK